MKNYLGLTLLFAIVLAGAWLRWQMAVHDPLWIDELHTSWVLSGGWNQILPRAISGNQSPLYFWLSYPVVAELGQSPLTLRLVSLLAACGVLSLGAWIVWRLTRSCLAAGTTALLLAVDSQLVFYASEARPYALIQFAALLLTWRSFLRLHSPETRPDWILLGLTLLLVLLHPTAILLTLSVAVLLFLQRRVPQPLDGAGIVAASLLGILLNPATSTWLQRRALWQGLVDLPEVLGIGLGAVLGAWLLPHLLRRWFVARSSLRGREPVFASEFAALPAPSPVAFWLGCFLGPTLVALLLTGSGIAGLATPRYLAAVWSFPAIGLGLQVAGLPWQRGLALAALGLFLLGFGALPMPQANGWRVVRTNPLAVSLWRERALLGMRSEGWSEVQLRLLELPDLERQTIWLYPNLIEDDLGERSGGGDERLNEYLTFPLRGIYAVPAAKLEPRAFRAQRLLTTADLPQLCAGAIQVVVRCAVGDVGELESVWREDWQQLGGRADELRIDLRLSAGDVHLLTIDGSAQPSGAEQPQ